MGKLISLSDARDLYGVSPDSVHQYKFNGIGDRFLKKVGGYLYIDIDEYFKQSNITKKCWNYNTEYLFWLGIDIFKSQSKMARYLADKSELYNSVTSWSQFLSITLFMPLDHGNTQIQLKPTQQSEFTRIMSKAVYIKIKDGYYDNVDENFLDYI